MTPHLYIHVPFCDGKCHYCGFYSVVASPALTQLYQSLPARELAHQLASGLSGLKEGELRTVYIGGGTPAMLGADGIKSLAESLASQISFGQVEEWTVELNPASVTPDLLKTFKALGVNRLSIGVQIFDDETLLRIGRRHKADAARKAIKLAQDSGFQNVGIDLIAGLPGVTPALWQASLEQAASLGLAHLSVYALTLEPDTPLAAQVAKGLKLPTDEAQLAALAQAQAVLNQAGFRRYEISNYALPDRECRHNLGIWRGNDFLGLGPAAASRVGGARWTNSEDLAEYIESLTGGELPPCEMETLDEAGDALERVVFALRLDEGIDPFEDARRFPALRDRAPDWEQRLEGLASHGITERGGRRWRLTARGKEICDSVIRELF